MTKLRADLRIATLGAFAGLFTFSFFLLADRVDVYYDHLAALRADNYNDYQHTAQNLWWMPLAFWHVLLFVLSGFVVHRYFADLRDSPFLLMQLVGIGALCGWVLTPAVAVAIEALMHNRLDLEQLSSRADLLYAAKFFAAVFAANTVCASFVHSAARLYAPRDGRPDGAAPAA